MSKMKCEVRKVIHAFHLDVNTLLYYAEILRIIKVSDKSTWERIEADNQKGDVGIKVPAYGTQFCNERWILSRNPRHRMYEFKALSVFENSPTESQRETLVGCGKQLFSSHVFCKITRSWKISFSSYSLQCHWLNVGSLFHQWTISFKNVHNLSLFR